MTVRKQRNVEQKHVTIIARDLGAKKNRLHRVVTSPRDPAVGYPSDTIQRTLKNLPGRHRLVSWNRS